VTPRKLSCILQELDESDLEEIYDEDETELFANQVSREFPLFDGNWSDNTDEDPDYIPDLSSSVTLLSRKQTETEEVYFLLIL
jgi:hypothetical protein